MEIVIHGIKLNERDYRGIDWWLISKVGQWN